MIDIIAVIMQSRFSKVAPGTNVSSDILFPGVTSFVTSRSNHIPKLTNIQKQNRSYTVLQK